MAYRKVMKDAESSVRVRHVAALITGNVALALGPWAVRIADSGPVSAGFWRLALAIPLLALLARANREPLLRLSRTAVMAIVAAGVFYGIDLAAFHVGIELTRLGNASLFGNSGSLIIMVWSLVAARRRPHPAELVAFAAALAGSAILLGRSLEIDARTLTGDLLCLFAGFCYAFYLLPLQHARGTIGGWSLLTWTSAASAPILLGIALALGEPVWPQHWGPVVALALGAQVVGQGMLVYALRHFSALVIGLGLLAQPAVSVVAGWLVFDEKLAALDVLGMMLVAAALVLARAGERKAA